MNPKNMLRAVKTTGPVIPPKIDFFDTPPLMVSVEILAKAFRDSNLPAPPVDMWKRHQSIDFYLGMFSAMKVCLYGCKTMEAPANLINELQYLNGQLANIIEDLNKKRIITEI